MPYTDFTDVIQDDADAIRYIDGSTASIVFADMPNRILAINGLRFGSSHSAASWVGRFLPYITGSEYITDMSYMFSNSKLSGNPNFSNFSTVSATNMQGMFSHAGWLRRSYLATPNIQSLNLSNFDTSNVTNMAGMFEGCGVRLINLSSFDTSNVTNMHGMFDNCMATSIDISDFDVSNVTNMQYMFAYAPDRPSSPNIYSSLDFSNWNTSSLTDVAGMFWGYKSYRVDLDLSSFDTSNLISMSRMFGTEGNMTNIWTIDFSNWDTANVGSMANMFERFHGIIWVPSTFVGTSITNPNYKPFHGFESLGASVEVYTDATDAGTQGWGTIDSDFTMHYNSTHQDFLNAISQ